MKKINIKPLSVNFAWQGKRYKTPQYLRYEQSLFFILPNIKIPKDCNLQIYLEFGFSSKNNDWDNPIKPFVDILQKKYNFNDNRIYKAMVEKKKVKRGREYIAFNIQKY